MSAETQTKVVKSWSYPTPEYDTKVIEKRRKKKKELFDHLNDYFGDNYQFIDSFVNEFKQNQSKETAKKLAREFNSTYPALIKNADYVTGNRVAGNAVSDQVMNVWNDCLKAVEKINNRKAERLRKVFDKSRVAIIKNFCVIVDREEISQVSMMLGMNIDGFKPVDLNKLSKAGCYNISLSDNSIQYNFMCNRGDE